MTAPASDGGAIGGRTAASGCAASAKSTWAVAPAVMVTLALTSWSPGNQACMVYVPAGR